MFNKAGLGNLMQQAQKMQEKMKQAQAELANITVEGEAGGGMVKITLSCHHAVKRVHIDDSLAADAASDKEMLEDVIAAAFNDAARKVAAGLFGLHRFSGSLHSTLGLPEKVFSCSNRNYM